MGPPANDQLAAPSDQHARVLDQFHPAVGSWFTRQFPKGPTEPQAAAWPLIASGRDVLVASPTGTGKTLTGFLVAIDAACRLSQTAGSGATDPVPRVLYISPLRALAADVHQNLQLPLVGIRAEAERLGLKVPEVSVETIEFSLSELSVKVPTAAQWASELQATAFRTAPGSAAAPDGGATFVDCCTGGSFGERHRRPARPITAVPVVHSGVPSPVARS